MVDNYSTDGVLHSRLSLYRLSFEDDTGNYTNVVKNQCGESFVFIKIDVRNGRRLLMFNIVNCYSDKEIVWESSPNLLYCTLFGRIKAILCTVFPRSTN